MQWFSWHRPFVRASTFVNNLFLNTVIYARSSNKKQSDTVQINTFQNRTILKIIVRGGSGQFFSPRVGFRVFWFCSGRVSGFGFFFRVKRKISRVTSGKKKYMFGSNSGQKFLHFWPKKSQKYNLQAKIGPQMTKIWRKMQKIGFISHNFLTSGYSG